MRAYSKQAGQGRTNTSYYILHQPIHGLEQCRCSSLHVIVLYVFRCIIHIVFEGKKILREPAALRPYFYNCCKYNNDNNKTTHFWLYMLSALHGMLYIFRYNLLKIASPYDVTQIVF